MGGIDRQSSTMESRKNRATFDDDVVVLIPLTTIESRRVIVWLEFDILDEHSAENGFPNARYLRAIVSSSAVFIHSISLQSVQNRPDTILKRADLFHRLPRVRTPAWLARKVERWYSFSPRGDATSRRLVQRPV